MEMKIQMEYQKSLAHKDKSDVDMIMHLHVGPRQIAY